MRLISMTCLAALVFVAPAKADDPVTAADLKRLLPGNFHVVAGPVSLNVKFSAGGAVSGVTDKGDHDSGRWHVAGNEVCVKFKKWLDRQQKCEHLTQAGNELKGSVFSAWRK